MTDDVAAQPDNPTYAEFIRGLVDRQDQRKASLESRGITVITTAGALASLLFALSSFLEGASRARLAEGAAASCIRGSLIAFGCAAVLALVTNVPLFYTEPRRRAGIKLLDEWADTEAVSRKEVAKVWAKVFESAKRLNGCKAWVLLVAALSEVVGIGLVAAAVWLTLP